MLHIMLYFIQGDHEDPVRVLKGGGFVSNQPVHFTHSTFFVANEQVQLRDTT